MVRSMYCGKVRFNLRNIPMTLEDLIDIFFNMWGPDNMLIKSNSKVVEILYLINWISIY